MRSVVEQGSVCNIHGCSQATITHQDCGEVTCSTNLVNQKELEVEFSNENEPAFVEFNKEEFDLDVQFQQKDRKPVSSTFGFMCQTSQGAWEYLLVEEGAIYLIDGQEVLVKRQGYGL